MSVTPENNFDSCIKDEKEGLTDYCRVCMCTKINMKCAFSTGLSQTVEELQFCTGILMTKDDGLPTKLCESCLVNLTIAYKFKNTCVRSDRIFRQMLEQKLLKDKIKKEVIELGDDVDNFQYVMTKQEVTGDDGDDDGVSEAIFDIECKTKSSIRPKSRKPLSKRKTKGKVKIVAGEGAPEKKFRKLYCEVCNTKFGSKELALEHKRDVHGCEWVCEICGKQFMHRASHYSHIRSHLPPQYECSHCDYKSWHKADLNKHIRIHTGNKLYVCEYCTSSFHNTSNLRGHIQRNHGGSKTHFCPRCDLSFFSAHKLRRHLDSHDNIKRFECDICHAQFTRRCHWKRHLEKQHSIVVPQMRPGRRKINAVIGDDNEKHPVVKTVASVGGDNKMNEQQVV